MELRNPHNRLVSIGQASLLIALFALCLSPEIAAAAAASVPVTPGGAFGQIEAAVRSTATVFTPAESW